MGTSAEPVAETGLPPPAVHPVNRRWLWMGVASAIASLQFWWSRVLFPAASPPLDAAVKWYWPRLLVLGCLSGWMLFGDLSYPLFEPDEGRYAEIGRQMVMSGDWIVPTLNRTPFYDKPPLFYWLVAGSFQLFGVSDAVARLPAALAAFLTIMSLYVLGGRIVGTRPALIAALALTATASFIQAGRFVIVDSLLTLFVTLALLLAYEAVQGKRVFWTWWLASALCCGLGIMTKGPVAFVLTAPPLIAYSWLNRDKARLRPTHWAAFVAAAGVVVAPWYVAISLKDPRFLYHFFVEQNLARFLHKFHEEPAWFYVIVLYVGCLPWSVLLIPFLRFLFRNTAPVRALRSQAMGFFMLWLGWVFVFFSMAHSKLPTYVLPAMPAAFLLVGCYLDNLLFHSALAGLYRPARIYVPRWLAVGLAAALVAQAFVAWRLHLIDLTHAVVEIGLFGACTIGLVLWNRRIPAKSAWLACGIAATMLVHEIVHEVVPGVSRRHATHATIAALARDGTTPVVCYGGEWGSVPFYLKRDEVIFNLSNRPHEEVYRFVNQHTHFVLVVKHRYDLHYFQKTVCPDWEFNKVMDVDQYVVADVRALHLHQKFEQE